ncbi:SURF4 family-domain-containing protein [Entophlyctis helioformis]|nr:SURF4 family-domain-containing protein [Entophlyctis helioformis]
MDALSKYSAQAEAVLDKLAAPVKPFLPGIARFLLVVTFLEDAVRITFQWSDQNEYLRRHQGFPSFLAQLFLALNVIVMIAGSSLAIMKRYTEIAVAGLFGVIVIQSIGYGLIFNASFLLRSLSVIGGLLMLLADAFATRRKPLFAGLPTLNETDKNAYLQLFGRVLLVFLFMSFVLNGEFSILRVIVSIVGLIGCIMVVVGFRARMSAWLLVTFLCVSNVVLNNWWSLHHNHPRRDFLKYDFFQTMSVIGGFLLLANQGAGGYSMDEKKKNF